MRGDSLLQERTRIRVFKNVQGNLPLKIPTSTARTTRSAAQLAHISVPFVPHLERVYWNLRQQLKRKAEDKMEDLDVNTLIWRMFVSVTQQAAVHLGNDYLDDLHPTTKQPQRTAKQLFGVRRKVGQRGEKSRFFP